ncbi:hypothetical protein L3X38_040906 [Prunus dulcis]|uniref:EF-hand domain-containing protein n=1 Tax=Prunus dulcis TaxID=3755 RepID=A0AAD4US83_PRUDU|nr:hypothetical protein L3X38_040906 [Prunus dulcis]
MFVHQNRTATWALPPVGVIYTLAFRLYDQGQTGFIEREEVKQMVIAIMMESDLKVT